MIQNIFSLPIITELRKDDLLSVHIVYGLYYQEGIGEGPRGSSSAEITGLGSL